MKYNALVKTIQTATDQFQGRAVVAVNQALVIRNWLVGSWIFEFEQHGSDRAKYGERLLETLAKDLSGKGLEIRNLRNCRLFYATYPQIRQTLSAESAALTQEITPKSSTTNSADSVCRIPAAPSPESPTPLSPEMLLQLSWSHLVELIAIDDLWKRAFFENECLLANWSVRQLRRQIGSLLYERTGLSTNKKNVIQKARKQERQQDFTDLIRDPYVLEFTGLAERPEYSEDELESALLDHVQMFLLELGRGFCFEARQFRMTEGRKHHRVDMVFYHRILRCHVLIDLKIRAFKPADAGQMNFYVNWCKANMMSEGDNPPVGIILCSDKDGAEVEFATAGMDQKLFVSRYLVALPSVEKLRRFLEADRERIESLMPPPSSL